MKTHLNNLQIGGLIAYIVIILMAIGTVFVFSAGANLITGYHLQRFYDFTTLRQVLFFPLAVGIMYLFSLIDYRRFSLSLSASVWKSPVTYMLLFSIVLLVLVLIPGIGIEINYARRWLRIPLGPISMSFQPSELAKWSILFFLAAFLDKFQPLTKDFKKGFLPICLIAGFVAILIIKEDFGTAAFICLLTFLMLLIGGATWKHFLLPLPLVIPVFILAVVTSSSRVQRIMAFLHPEELAGSAAYQANQSLIAIATGGVTGKGLGRGICKYGHLPEDTTDFIFAIVAEEMGLVGSIAIIILFIALIILTMIIVLRTKDRFGRLLAAAIGFAITIQAAINIGVVTVVLPTKGIPLPFVSAGGTSMLLSAAAIGVLINIAKQSRLNPEVQPE